MNTLTSRRATLAIATIAAVAAVATLATTAGPAFATNMSFMKDTPYAKMTAEDRKMLHAAVDTALVKSADGDSSEWANPATGAGGTIKTVKSTERAGLPCRTLAIANKTKLLSASGEYRFCKDK